MKTIKITTVAFLIFVLPLISLGQGSVPPPPSDHGQNGDQSPDGGPAPVGGGIAILLTMGAAYGGKKYYDYRKKLNNEMED